MKPLLELRSLVGCAYSYFPTAVNVTKYEPVPRRSATEGEGAPTPKGLYNL
jgi:hypothetical protein